jgi:hypothetical protein
VQELAERAAVQLGVRAKRDEEGGLVGEHAREIVVEWRQRDADADVIVLVGDEICRQLDLALVVDAHAPGYQVELATEVLKAAGSPACFGFFPETIVSHQEELRRVAAPEDALRAHVETHGALYPLPVVVLEAVVAEEEVLKPDVCQLLRRWYMHSRAPLAPRLPEYREAREHRRKLYVVDANADLQVTVCCHVSLEIQLQPHVLPRHECEHVALAAPLVHIRRRDVLRGRVVLLHNTQQAHAHLVLRWLEMERGPVDPIDAGVHEDAITRLQYETFYAPIVPQMVRSCPSLERRVQHHYHVLVRGAVRLELGSGLQSRAVGEPARRPAALVRPQAPAARHCELQQQPRLSSA